MGRMATDGQGNDGRGRCPGRWRNGFSIVMLLAAGAAIALVVFNGRIDSIELSDAAATEVATSTRTATASATRPAATHTPSPEATITPSATSTKMPSATPTLTSTPTGTPTQAPTATSTPIPSERLSDARHLQRNGDTIAARRALEDLISDAPDGPEAAEARFRLAQGYHLDGLHAEAVAAFHAFLNEHPDDRRRPEAHFLLGESLAASGLWDQAIVAYQAYLSQAGNLLADMVLQRVGNAYRELGDTGEAQAAYAAALAATTDAQTSRSLRQALAQLHFGRGEFAESAAHYEGLLALAQTPAQKAEAELRWAQDALPDSVAIADSRSRLAGVPWRASA